MFTVRGNFSRGDKLAKARLPRLIGFRPQRTTIPNRDIFPVNQVQLETSSIRFTRKTERPHST